VLYELDGVFNAHISRLSARGDPHYIHESGYEAPFSVSVWADIVGGTAVGPCLLPDRLTAQQYPDFIETLLPGLPKYVLLPVRKRQYIV
jgi:hypothetical protein